MEVIKKTVSAILFYILVSCSEPIDISLKGFNLEEDVFDLGKELMSVDHGLSYKDKAKQCNDHCDNRNNNVYLRHTKKYPDYPGSL